MQKSKEWDGGKQGMFLRSMWAPLFYQKRQTLKPRAALPTLILIAPLLHHARAG